MWILDLLPWAGWAGLTLALALWVFGAGKVAAEGATILRLLAETIIPLLGRAAEALGWFLKNVVGKGLKDILDDWVTIVTVALMGVILFAYMRGTNEYHLAQKQTQLNACIADLKRAKKTPTLRPTPPPASQFKWPWET